MIGMKIGGYKINLDFAIEEISKKKCKYVVLQFPEGLKQYALKIAGYLEKHTDASIIISADPCFGACDVFDHTIEDVDLVVQFGHTSMPGLEKNTCSAPTIYINAQSTLNVSKVVKKAAGTLKNNLSGIAVGIATTAQHVHEIKTICEVLKELGFKPKVGKAHGRIEYDGQVLGCNFSTGTSIAEKIDGFLFVGSGSFHPLGLALVTGKQVVVADPYTNEVRFEEIKKLKDKILRQRYGAIVRAKDAQVFGILIGLKAGQQRLGLADSLRKLLVSQGKKAVIFVINDISPEYLQSFRDIDCFVSTACPRTAIDDYLRYKVPVLTPIELEILLGKRSWDNYQFDQIM